MTLRVVRGSRFMLPELAKAFILAGNARITLVSSRTGTRFTYRVRKSVDGQLHFVALMTGPDNDSDYEYLGLIGSHETYVHGRKSQVSESAPSAIAFKWMWNHIRQNSLPQTIEVWHEGRCGRCARVLTVPASIESGFGPECINHV